ncbi:MAG: outer membrane lipoprotein carrier protein LolA [Gemmatimonadetes bacterium]|nr:outer membrane lipoprotein carrier protein LolA [Gemmatimonadota bacterium]
MSRFRVALSTVLLLAAGGPLVAQQQGAALLEDAGVRYAGLTTLCADFVQVLDNPILGDQTTSRGRLCQRRPNLFRMDFSDPEGDQVVADGDHFWVYYRSLNPDQVIRIPVDPSRGGLDFFREFLDDPTSKYDIRSEEIEQIAGVTTMRLALDPLSPRGLESARVWVDPSARLIRKLEIVDENGLVRTLHLANFAFDPELVAGHFEFDLPEGVDVVAGG